MNFLRYKTDTRGHIVAPGSAKYHELLAQGYRDSRPEGDWAEGVCIMVPPGFGPLPGYEFAKGAKENPITPTKAITAYSALRNRVKAFGLNERDVEVLGDVARRFGDRRLPFPGASVVYDRSYVKLRDLDLIQLSRHSEGYSSFQDHFVLTPEGDRVLTGSGRGRRVHRLPPHLSKSRAMIKR